MRGLTVITALLLTSPALCARSNPPGKDAILLSNVNTLTLRANSLTKSRRVSPIQQLTCVGPSKKICGLYQPEVMRCTNQGYGYNEEDIEWTCEASLPSEFKLGATDVVCEGYRSADDKWVLKGSCGVEYRMLLTEHGEDRFGRSANKNMDDSEPWAWWASLLFFMFMFGTFAVIIWQLCWGAASPRRDARRARRGFWGGGGGGGGGPGGGGGGGYDPYSGQPPAYGSWDTSAPGCSSQGWTPGFWTGALGGGAAGYAMGRRRSSQSQRGHTRYNSGEGSSGGRSPPRFSSTSSSTGFGSTKRR